MADRGTHCPAPGSGDAHCGHESSGTSSSYPFGSLQKTGHRGRWQVALDLGAYVIHRHGTQ
ncbi:hypothetical protein [Solicola gregarius]|uniref:Uncharacterized protein n=1 Tax=Solicola gregarius TaxID=2908642 RepID=A0AA46YJ46_9ACTN|nr:hypothetical protein [Solicola gregarius]UYM04080.1 hypothetical protein L0C25_16220 [Solicola gregarius]